MMHNIISTKNTEPERKHRLEISKKGKSEKPKCKKVKGKFECKKVECKKAGSKATKA